MVLRLPPAAGKGKGKAAPPPPKVASKPPRAVAWSGPNVAVRNGNLKSVGETIITGIDGTRRIERPNGTVEVIKPEQKAVEDRPHNGRLADPAWPLPQLAVECDALARPGYLSGKAHEYLDDEQVLRSKVALLASMLRKAKHTVVYGGAGLSTASGISDYATRTGSAGVLAKQKVESEGGKDAAAETDKCKDKGGRADKRTMAPSSFYSAQPNLGHRVVAAMAQQGFVWRFIQQNHDGLPQKAGLPQRLMNEIHGGIFDPSNPVVPMSGNLRSDLFKDLLLCERKVDLLLTLGSSLAGMNADRLVKTCSERAERTKSKHDALGSVIVSLQTTPHDAQASVRVYATIDRTMELLAEHLVLDVPPTQTPLPPLPTVPRPLGIEREVFEVPYDERGQRLEEGHLRRSWDLRYRSIHFITIGPNKGARAIILGKLEDTHYRVGIRLRPDFQGDYEEIRIMGSWWVNAAVAGEVEMLPIMNLDEKQVATDDERGPCSAWSSET